MGNTKHQSIIYNGDSKYDNYIDPITKHPFKNSEQVILCREKNSLLTSRSLKFNDYQCPFCGKKLNNDLTIDMSVVPPEKGPKEQVKYGGPSSPPPRRPNTSPILWLGLVIVLIFCFILTVSGVFVSIIGSGGSVSNPASVSSTIRPTSTKSSQVPRSTNTPNNQPVIQPTKTPKNTQPVIQPTKTPKNTRQYAEISCAEIHKVNLRRTPGYVGKNNNTDSLYEIPCGEFVEILGPTRKADGLTWWNVYWNGYTGWIADHTGSGKVILDFSP